MNARLMLLPAVLCTLLAACATTSSGGSNSPSKTTPTGKTAPADTKSGSASPDQKGSASPAGSAGTASASQRTDGSADPGVPARTPAEQRAEIDNQLDASLGRFDDKLRREQQSTASQRDAHAGARAEGAAVDAAGGGNGIGSDKDDADEIHHDRSGDLQSAGLPDATAGGDPTSASQNATGGGGVNAKPIPSGADDDIIARRLRRAAEAETDPELKEKLWKEYRDYKENTKGST